MTLVGGPPLLNGSNDSRRGDVPKRERDSNAYLTIFDDAGRRKTSASGTP